MADENRITDIPGDTTHQGTAGADTFVFGPGYTNADTITGFTNGTDLIDLTRFQGITRFEDLTVTSDDNGVTIDLTGHGGGTILLSGFSIDNLDAADFVFSTLDGGGTSGDDTLQADNDGDRVDGGAGDDTITGGAGWDILIGGAGDDTIYGGAEADGLAGHEGDDELYGGAGSDFLEGGEGDDRLEGGSGDDEMYGDAGDDALYGGEGNDILHGGEGKDDLSGGAGDDTLYGGPEGESIWHGWLGPTLEGGEGNDTIYGGEGNVIIKGDAGNDFLYGGTGKDSIYGGTGSDVIDGGAGNDRMYGDDSIGSGVSGSEDTFVFQQGHGNDTIAFFKDGEDKIDLSAFTEITGVDDLTIRSTHDGTVIDLTEYGGGTIRFDQNSVEDVEIGDLDATDFLFYEPPADMGEGG